MQFFQSLMPMAGLVAVANAYVYGAPSNTTAVVPVPPPAATVTVVTTDYTTYCPSATTFIHRNVTYTATEATTLTITNCPCQITTHYPAPVVETHSDTTVTVTQTPVTVIADCTPVGPDGKPTPTHASALPSQPAPVVSSKPVAGTPSAPAPAPPATSGPVLVTPNGAERVGAGLGAVLLAAALL